MVDVVGLRFVTEGQKEALDSLRNYQQGLTTTSDLQDKHVATMNRAFNDQIRGLQNLIRARERVAREEERVIREQERAFSDSVARYVYLQKLKTRAAQEEAETQRIISERSTQWTEQLNERMGITGARATELGATFARLAEVQQNLQAAATAWTSALDERMGVTGQRATELGATFDRLNEVQQNLDAAAASWTSALDERMGVTGARATEMGATFGRLAEVQQNLQAAATAWTGALNERMGVTGQRATELGATFGRLVEVQQNLQAAATAWTGALNERMGVTGARATELGATFGRLAEVQKNLQAAATAWTGALNERMGVTGQRATELGATFERLGEVQRNIAASAAAWTAALNERLGVTGTYKDAAASADVFVAAQARVTNSYEETKRAMDPLYAASQRYAAQVQALTAFHQQAGNSAEMLAADVQALQESYLRAGIAIDGMGAASYVGGRGLNNMNMVIQQAGYQVGDFFVQVQSGTSALVALSQQGSQLLGVFGGPWGAVFGAALAIGTAFAGTLLNMRGAADETRDAVEELYKSLDEYQQFIVTATTNTVELAETFGRFAEQVRGFSTYLAEVSLGDVMRDAAAAADQIAAPLQDALGLYMDVQNAQAALAGTTELAARGLASALDVQNAADFLAMMQDMANDAAEAVGLTSAQVVILNDALTQVGASESLSDMSLAAADVLRYLEMWYPAGSQLPPELAAAARAMEEVVRRAAEATTQAERMQIGIDDAYRAALALAGGFSAANTSAAGLLGTVRSVAAAAWNAAAGMLQTQINRNARLATLPQERLEDERGNTGRAQNFIDQQRAAESVVRYGAAITGPAAGGGGGGGGPSPAEQLAQDLERLRMSLDDAYANQQRFTEGQNILNASLDAGKLTLPEYEHLLALLTEEYGAGETAAYDYAQAMLSIGETMRSGLEDAFMSIVDGSASAGDAFRNLARTVIAEAYRMLVVKPLVDMIMRGANALFGGVSIGGAPVSLLPSANGNAFMNGRVMAFADGGIVGSPTFFPLRGGMGLMGEAGPEAIMPLKRGPDGKLGVAARGDGTTVVNQYFSIAANGDESVRRIVRAEAPNIAEAAKNAVLDAKRRGGAYGRAF